MVEDGNMIVYHETLSGKVTFALPTYLHNGKVKCSCECPGNNPSARTGCVDASKSKLVSVVHHKNIALRFDGEMIDGLTGRCFEKSDLFRVHRISWMEEVDRNRIVNYLKCYVSQRQHDEGDLDWKRIFRMINKICPCIISIEFEEETSINNTTTNDNVLSLFFIYNGKATGLMAWVNHVDAESVTPSHFETFSKSIDQVVPSVNECSSGIDISESSGVSETDPPNRPISCAPDSSGVNAHLLDLLNRPHSTVPVLTGRPDPAAAVRRANEIEAKKGGNLFFFSKCQTPLTEDGREYVQSLATSDDGYSDSVHMPYILPPKNLKLDASESIVSTDATSTESIPLPSQQPSPPPLQPAYKPNERPNIPLNSLSGNAQKSNEKKKSRWNGQVDKTDCLRLPILSPGTFSPPFLPPTSAPARSKKRRPSSDVQPAPDVPASPNENVPAVGDARNIQNMATYEHENSQPSYPIREPAVNYCWRLPDKYLPDQNSVSSYKGNSIQTTPVVGWQPVGGYLHPMTPSTSAIVGAASPPIAYQRASPPVSLPHPPPLHIFPSAAVTSNLTTPSVYVSSENIIGSNQNWNGISGNNHNLTPSYHVTDLRSSAVSYQPQNVSDQIHAVQPPVPYTIVSNSSFPHVANPSFDPSGSFRIPQPPEYGRRFGPLT